MPIKSFSVLSHFRISYRPTQIPYVESILKDTETPYKNIIEILDARIIGEIPYDYVTGNVYTNTELVAGQKA